MSKTPDEIKKGLGEAIAETSWVVDNGDAHDLQDACDKARTSMADALAIIQRKEQENAELLKKVEQLQAERDAAVEDLETVCGMCSVCCACKDRFEGGESCMGCTNSNHWNWRGVQKEE